MIISLKRTGIFKGKKKDKMNNNDPEKITKAKKKWRN